MTLPLFLLLIALAAVFMSIAMSVAWLVQRRTGNSGWVDAFWTFSVGIAGVVAALSALPGQHDRLRAYLVAALVAAWSLRLALHIVQRTIGMDDDPRYAKMREEWGDHAPQQMFLLLHIQALVSIPLVLSIAVAAWNMARPAGWQDVLAVVILGVAIVGEGIADAQLRRFVSNPANRGKVCKAGLWRWSRHPNYFFEWLVWIAYPVFAINLDGSHPWGWIALTAPLFMYWLLTRISGIPLLEEHMESKYGDPYREYQRTTNSFFPLPPAA